MGACLGRRRAAGGYPSGLDALLRSCFDELVTVKAEAHLDHEHDEEQQDRHGQHDLDCGVAAFATGSEGSHRQASRLIDSAFDVTLATTEQLAPKVPKDRIVIGESGIFTHLDIARLQKANVNTFLVGESLMRQDDVTTATKALLG